MRSEFHFEAFKLLLIESRFLAVELTDANALPCCVSIASDVSNRTILGWQVYSSSSLAKAAIFALDSMFERASNADPGELRLGHRYRYGNCEYEVTEFRDDCIWLQRWDSRHREATKIDSQATPSPQLQALSNRTPPMRAGVPTTGKQDRPNPPKHSRLNRQPEAIQHLILEVVHSNYLWQRLSGRELAAQIFYQIAQWNESRPSEEQLKAPSYYTLYQLIRELREHSKHSL